MSDVAKHWIDGESTGSDTVSESITPATGEVLGPWADGGEAEARAAVAAARRAFETSPCSRDRSPRHRALSEMADRFDAHAEELGRLVTMENGKKLAEGMREATLPGIALRHAAAQALGGELPQGRLLDSSRPSPEPSRSRSHDPRELRRPLSSPRAARPRSMKRASAFFLEETS